MEHTGNDLKADVEYVWEAVSKSFPTMANSYRDANCAVHNTYSADTFEADFIAKWVSLRNETQYIFGHAARALHDTATAIGESLDAYVEGDDAAADALREAKKDLPDAIPEMGETAIPKSGRYYAGEYYEPPPPSFQYEGGAPEIDDLRDKASTVEDKLYEAMCAEMNWPDGWIMSWFDRDTFDGTADEENVAKKTGGVVAKIDECTKGHPKDLANAVGSLTEVGGSSISPFNSFSTEVKNARDALDPDVWSSDAATEFRRNFLNAYDEIAETHVVLVGSLAGSLSGYQDALEATYKTYNEAMDEAIAACDAIKEGSTHFEALMTAVLSAAITVAGTVYTGGSATAIKFALAGSGVSVGSAAINGGGGTVEDIRENVIDAIDTAFNKLKKLDEELTEKVGSDDDEVSGSRHDPDKKIDLPTPEFTYDFTDPY